MFFKTRMTTPPCKFFNTDKGCKFTPEECKRPHAPFCTNNPCVKANTQHTHTHANCGRKAKADDQPVKPIANVLKSTRVALCEKLFVKVEKTLKETETDLSGILTFKPTAGKIVGMFHESLDLKVLTEMLTNDAVYSENMADAVDVLRAAAVLETV